MYIDNNLEYGLLISWAILTIHLYRSRRRNFRKHIKSNKLLESYRTVNDDKTIFINELKEQQDIYKQKLNKSLIENQFLHEFSDRHEHDCSSRFSIIELNLKKIKNKENQDLIDKSLHQLIFLKDAITVHLTPNISEYIRQNVESTREQFNLTKRIHNYLNTSFDLKDPKNRLVFNCEVKDIILFGKWTPVEIMLDNIINNAFRHSSKNSDIIVSVTKINTFVQITIRNNGPHIPDDLRKEIFNKGFSIRSRNPNTQKGGFGLYFAKQVVTGYDGSIECKNFSTSRLLANDLTSVEFIIKLPILIDDEEEEE